VASVLIPVDFRLFPPERQAKIRWRAFLENVDKAIWLLDRIASYQSRKNQRESKAPGLGDDDN
jgi:hypothetical protein